MRQRDVLALYPGDVLRLRRAHPCGATDWLVDRLGADIGITCTGCGRRVLVGRSRLERRIASFVRRGVADTSASAGPTAPGPGG